MEAKAKPFWKKPENIVGLLIGGALIYGGGLALMTILPMMLMLATNTIMLAAMVGGMVMLTAAIIQQRTMIKYMWRSAMRWITGWFVELDPIGIMRTYSENLKKQFGKLSDEISNLRGQVRKTKTKIDQNKREYDQAMGLVREAHKLGDKVTFAVQSQKATMLEEFNEKLKTGLENVEKILNILTRTKENCDIKIQTLDNTIEIKAAERDSLYATTNAIASARSIIAGNPDERAMLDASLEAHAEAVARDLGEFDDFVSDTASLLAQADLEKGVIQTEALKKIQAWENKDLLAHAGEESVKIPKQLLMEK